MSFHSCFISYCLSFLSLSYCLSCLSCYLSLLFCLN